MRAAAFALAASAALAAPLAAQTPAQAHLCEATAVGDNGEEVTVFLVRTADNSYSSSDTMWFPGLADASGPSGFELPDAVLAVNYDNSAQDRIGDFRNMSVTAAAVSPPRAQIASAALQKRIASYRIDYAFDGGPTRTLTMKPIGAALAAPGTAASQGEMGQPLPIPRYVELRLVAKKPQDTMVRRFALTPTDSRDALYTKAWAEAEAKFASPAGKCEAIN